MFKYVYLLANKLIDWYDIVTVRTRVLSAWSELQFVNSDVSSRVFETNRNVTVVSDTRKFDHGLTQILHDDLHWFGVADRVTYKLGVIMHRCRHGKAPQYLVDCCTPVTDVVGRQRLRSATQQLMVVPRHWLSTVGCRAFAVHGPKVCNSLPDDLRAQQDYESFRRGLKTWLFSRY